MSVIKVTGMSCGYRGRPDVLEDINLELDDPGLVCIIGPNGVGKSTLVKCLTGSIKPSEGEVSILGKKVSDYKLKDLAKIVGYVPVTSSDHNNLTVAETVLVGRFARQGMRTSSKDLQAAYRALKALEIEDLAGRGFNELSAGQHQKVAIARGLVQQTRILILDEPT
ncbi:MAG: ABC transporter ATP-binding protein, partial [Candidatus Methanomethylophilaceae archaeon]|nr:ABC transporter ATP-binding protein [Candidatus Methanomethylophilaceae archaeon]